MFHSKQADIPEPAAHPAAAQLAQIQGGGLVQIIITRLDPITYACYLNHQFVSDIEIDTLSVLVEVEDGPGSSPTVRATLSRYVDTVAGQKGLQHFELFPCTLEIVAPGRRVSVTCREADSLEGCWISLGLNVDGTGNDITGLRSLRVLLTHTLVDAQITWMDGTSEQVLTE